VRHPGLAYHERGHARRRRDLDGVRPPIDPEASFSARAGAPLPEGRPPASREAIVEALKTVYDPEIPVDIYELGLIYEFDLNESGQVRIVMTLTTPGCPVAGEMPGMVAEAVAAALDAGAYVGRCPHAARHVLTDVAGSGIVAAGVEY
jgi:metal-sulfur cluster biosynthetic enzyme